MADSRICDEIQAVLENGPIKVETQGDFRHVAGIHGSCDAVKRALGSLIKRNIVIRHRDHPESCSEQERPVTFKLSYR